MLFKFISEYFEAHRSRSKINQKFDRNHHAPLHIIGPITRHNFLAGQRIYRGQRGNALDNACIMQAAGKSDRENRNGY